MDTARAPKVTVLPATTSRLSSLNASNVLSRKRVAAYARVSTDNEEQLTSYEAQVDYYTRYIQENLEWEFTGVYADEGISGTSIKHREGFKRMIADALAGKIDLILTKSISRFARNTVDTLTTVRQLREKGVEVYFEKENIYTLDSKGELFITIFSSIAQEESRSLSTNVKWGIRKRFADGKIMMAYKQFLGYTKGADGNPEIVEEEAKVVRLIYKMFLEGQTPSSIAKWLTVEGFPTPAGKINWQAQVVRSILTNEKYCGNVVLQKSLTVDFLTKKKKKNTGEAPQYFVESSHSPVVPVHVFELVQAELTRRKQHRHTTSSMSCFANHISCGDCGQFFGRKLWHSTDKYRCTVWRCNRKYEKEKPQCTTPHLKEEQIKTLFVDAFNSIISGKGEILATFGEYIGRSTSTKNQEAACKRIDEECSGIEAAVNRLVSENTLRVLDQAEYNAKYNSLLQQYEELKTKKQELLDEIQRRKQKRTEMKEYLKVLKNRDTFLTEFDESLWTATVEKMVVYTVDRVVFHFKDGTELPWGARQNGE